MKKRLLLVAMLCSWMGMVVAQTNESVISADRPGMATGTDVMPKGKIQEPIPWQACKQTAKKTLNQENLLLRP